MSRRLHLTDKGMGCRNRGGTYCALVAEPLQPEQEHRYQECHQQHQPCQDLFGGPLTPVGPLVVPGVLAWRNGWLWVGPEGRDHPLPEYSPRSRMTRTT
jgi:hypothetical protein